MDDKDDKERKKIIARMDSNSDQLMSTIVDNYETDDLSRLFATLALILDASEMLKVDKETIKVFMLRGMFDVAEIMNGRLDDLGAELP